MNSIDSDSDHSVGPRVGLGLPAAIPNVPVRLTVEWASLAEESELQRLRDAGCDDVLLFPCSADVDQPRRLVGALEPLRL